MKSFKFYKKYGFRIRHNIILYNFRDIYTLFNFKCLKKVLILNDKIVNIPSCHVKPGDKVGVREKSKSINSIQESVHNNSSVYEWLTWDKNNLTGTFVSIPERIQIPENIKEQLIVELYSK